MAETAEFEVKYKYSGEEAIRRARKDLNRLNKDISKSLANKDKLLDKAMAPGLTLGTMGRRPGGRIDSSVFSSTPRPPRPNRLGNERFQSIMSGKIGGGFLSDIIEGNGLVGRLAQVGAAIFAWESAISAVGAAFGFVKTSVELVLGSVLRLGTALVSTMAHFFDFAQRSKLAFSTLIGDETLGKQTFDQTRQLAQDLGLEVEDTVDSYRKLLAAQFSIQDATNLTKATADLQALGASTDDVKHALLAISQIKMKGKLQAEELTRQLANAGVSSELVYQEIEKALFGKSDKETRRKVLAMQQAGKISSDVAIPAIMEAIKRKANEKNLGDVASKFANEKVGGMLNQLKAAFKNFFTSIGDDIEEPITNIAKFLFERIKLIISSPLIQQLRHNLGNAFVAAAEMIKAAWPLIEPLVVGVLSSINKSLQMFFAFVRDLSKGQNFEELSQKVATIATIMFVTGQVMFGVTKIVLGLASAVISLVEAFERLSQNRLARILISATGGLLSTIPGLGMANVLPQMGLGLGDAMAAGRADLSNMYSSGEAIGKATAMAPEGEGPLGGLLANIDSRKSGISGIGGTITQKSIGSVNNTINVTPLNEDDAEGFGGIIARAVGREVTKHLDEGS